MNEAKWQEFLKLYWTTIAYWEFVKAYREKPLAGPAMALAALAARNCLLFTIDKFVELCNKTANHRHPDLRPDFGDTGMKSLDALLATCERGSKEKDYEDCGVSVFRDKELGHPLNAIKLVLDKEPFAVSLEWRTVEETISLMSKFMEDVEVYHCDKGTWDFTSVKSQMIDVQDDYRGLVIKFEDAAKYDNLARRICLKGGWAKVHIVNRQEIELVE